MSQQRKNLARSLALFALKTICSDQKLQATPVPNFDLDKGPAHAKLIDAFSTTSQSFDLWRDDIKTALDELYASITHAVGDPNTGGILNDRMTNSPDATIRQIIADMRPTNKATIVSQLANYVPEPASDDGFSIDSDGESSTTPIPPTNYNPILIPPINYAALAGVDRIISQATGGAITSARAIFDKIDEAQRIIAAGIHAPAVLRETTILANAKEPSGKMQLTSALAPFVDCVPADQTEGFAFEIPVYHWDSPHPLVPRPQAGFQFDIPALRKALFAIAHGYNAVFVGPPGCGKTTLTAELAARLGRPFYRIPVDGEMRKREIIGGFKQVATPSGSEIRWFDGLLSKAISTPAIIDMDEIDRADPDLQYVAHQAYERKGLTLLEDEGRFIPPHPHHAILATANTRGRDDGENLYEMRNQMSEATRDRFPFWIDCKYMTEEQEKKQLSIDAPGLHKDSAEKIIRFANLMRGAFLSGKLSTTCSYRQTLACATFAATAPSATPDKRLKAEIDSIHAILVSRAPLRNEITALLEFGRQIYGGSWRTE